VEERGETAVYLVTEAVSPLWPTLRSLGVDGPAREQYLSMGLHQVVSALAFLNGDCRLVHGNLCAAAVVVTDSLDWKLHAFDLTTDHQFSTAPGEEVPLTAAAWMVGAQYKPGEVARGDWGAVREGPAWGVDAWGLGCLMQELFSGAALARTEDLRNIEAVPQPLLTYYQVRRAAATAAAAAAAAAARALGLHST
jgi:SCY1-like protein 1